MCGERHKHTDTMRKNQILPTPEFRTLLQDLLRAEIAQRGNLRAAAEAARVDHSNLSKALAGDPALRRWDSVLLPAAEALLGLEVEECVRVVRIGQKKSSSKSKKSSESS